MENKNFDKSINALAVKFIIAFLLFVVVPLVPVGISFFASLNKQGEDIAVIKATMITVPVLKSTIDEKIEPVKERVSLLEQKK